MIYIYIYIYATSIVIELVLPNKKTGSKILRGKKQTGDIIWIQGVLVLHSDTPDRYIGNPHRPSQNVQPTANESSAWSCYKEPNKNNDVPIDFPVIVDLGKMPKLKSLNPNWTYCSPCWRFPIRCVLPWSKPTFEASLPRALDVFFLVTK